MLADVPIELKTTTPALADYTAVPLHEAELSAGPGAANHTEEVQKHLLFQTGWLRKIGVAPGAARLARVRGDSMIPMLFAGDLVMIDSTDRQIPLHKPRAGNRRSALYALRCEGEARIKWAERPAPDTVILYSENTPVYHPEVYTGADVHTLEVIGRVVWWAHTERG